MADKTDQIFDSELQDTKASLQVDINNKLEEHGQRFDRLEMEIEGYRASMWKKRNAVTGVFC